ncbi:MAG TPA: class I tRNA ligase family protein, partial [Myxococcota bacterium]|nr:class I tRNA ligase family protein [Myxococcota bacterium]
RQQAPFRAVLTHGFVVDGNGRKLSKSEGNYIDPAKIIDRDGADVLRLWTAAEDYRDDIRLSQEILTRLVEAYRKIRNTTRFMLGVISDFDPVADAIPDSELLEQDRWALARFGEVVAKVRESYDGYEFHNVVRTILAFMVSDLSQFYLDITKDRLYCSHPAGRDRRSAQTAIYRMLDAMIRLMAPVLSFTMEEAWSHHRRMPGSPDSVLLSGLPCADAFPKEAELLADMALLREVRDVVLKNLEEKRAARDIGHPLEASVLVRVKAGGEHDRVVARFADILPELFVVSRTTVERVDSIAPDVAAEAVVTPIVGERCARCWNYFETVGSVESHPDLCTRCADVIDSIG